MRDILKNFCNTLLPPKCLICRREGLWLCADHRKFEPAPKSCAVFKYLDDIHAATKYYDPTTKKVVEYFKFQGFRSVGDLMVQEITKDIPVHFQKLPLVPIPLHWKRHVWRGFNQAQILTKALQTRYPDDWDSLSLLKRSHHTQQQAKLGHKEREKNLETAFIWNTKIKDIPEKVVLVDDVVATGATLDSAARVLKEKGVKKVYALVFARGGGE